MTSVMWCFKRILATLEFATIAAGDGYEIITVLQLILGSYDLILHLYT